MARIEGEKETLETHIAVCDLRYQQINVALEKGDKRMQRIEWLIYALIAIVFLGPGFAAKLLDKLIH